MRSQKSLAFVCWAISGPSGLASVPPVPTSGGKPTGKGCAASAAPSILPLGSGRSPSAEFVGDSVAAASFVAAMFVALFNSPFTGEPVIAIALRPAI